MGSHLSPSSVSSESETFVSKPKSISSSKNEYIPKVRKPYTITKQRKKWTEEEHQKFLEALKLYGRAWRRIEEHVGSKTAVQIRSHAQKFFSKVARDPNCETDGSLNSIEIPPPRPKKKPMRPYPRKMVDLLQKEPERSFSPDLSVVDASSLSPTSILPTIGSDTFSPTVSELNNHCLSPTSCTTDAPSANLFCTEKDNECMTSNSFTIEKGLPSSVPDTISPSSSIKLFGKMVLITNSSLEQRLLDKEGKNGGSSTVSEVNSGQKKPGAIDSQRWPNFEVRGNVKGFVPYKRCVAERDTKSLANVFEESKGQKIRVCS